MSDREDAPTDLFALAAPSRIWVVLEEWQWEAILAKQWTPEIQEAIRDQIRVCVQADVRLEQNARKVPRHMEPKRRKTA